MKCHIHLKVKLICQGFPLLPQLVPQSAEGGTTSGLGIAHIAHIRMGRNSMTRNKTKLGFALHFN